MIAIAAVHALGAVFDDGAGGGAVRPVVRSAAVPARTCRVGVGLAAHRDWTRSAGWCPASRPADSPPSSTSGRCAAGRSTAPDHIALAIEGALLSRDDAAGRARLVETMGLVPGAVAARTLLRVAADDREPLRSRMAAVAALGDRGPPRRGRRR